MTAHTPEEICAAALVELGEQPIDSFDDGTDIATSCERIYPFVKENILSRYDWRFSVSKVQLSRLTEAPTSQWSYQFMLPPDRLGDGPLAAYESNAEGSPPILGWEIQRDVLLSNHTTIYVDYQTATAEAYWPPYFTELVRTALMSSLAGSVSEDSGRADYYRQVAFGMPSEGMSGGLFATAKARNAQDDPNDVMQDNTLIDARFGPVPG